MAIRRFLWDDVEDCVLEETDEHGTTLVTYTHEPGPFGPLLKENRGGTKSYYHFDALGSTTTLTDDTSAITDTFQYDAWGNQIARTGTTPTPYTWCGKWGYQDDSATTGGYYVRARTYQPTVARWTSVDPLGFIDSPNLYGYAMRSPLFRPDPSGNWTIRTVVDFFNWYYTGGGVPVDLPTMAPGVFEVWLEAISVELNSFKSRKMKDILGSAANCDNLDQTIRGNDVISVSTGGGVTNVLTVMGNSIVKVRYKCKIKVECEECCDATKEIKHIDALCQYDFNVRDRFANPLDWNSQSYERDEAGYQKCLDNCRTTYSGNDPLSRARLVRCKQDCNETFPRSEFLGATPYDITANWSDFGRKTWDYPGCLMRP